VRLDCPACGKTNEPGISAACSRCGCDLGRLRELLRAADWRLAAAALDLRNQRWEPALRHAEIGWSLRHSVPAARLAFLAALGLGDTPRASHWWQSAENAD
jgi:hypothetical protein